MSQVLLGSGGLENQLGKFVFTSQYMQDLFAQTVSDDPDAGAFNGATAFLFCNNLAPTMLTLYSDLVKPDWTGWATKATGTWDVGVSASGEVTVASQNALIWTVGTLSTQDRVWGWGLNNGTLLIGAQIFTSAVLVAPTDILDLAALLTWIK